MGSSCALTPLYLFPCSASAHFIDIKLMSAVLQFTKHVSKDVHMCPISYSKRRCVILFYLFI